MQTYRLGPVNLRSSRYLALASLCGLFLLLTFFTYARRASSSSTGSAIPAHADNRAWEDLPATLPSQLSYALPWSTVDGGGGSSNGGNFALDSTAGQPDAGPLISGSASSGGNYSLVGGFWTAVAVTAPPMTYNLFLPLIVR